MQKIYSAILVLFIASCTNVNGLKKISKPEADVTPFNKALATEYRDLYDTEFSSGHWINSRKFKLKSENAAKGQQVLPENIKNIKVQQGELENLNWAGGRLDNLMVDSVKEAYPNKLAHIQRLFDCWVERAENNAKKDKIEECRMDFVLETANLENILMPVIENHTLSAALNTDGKLVIYFGVNSDNINPDGMDIIKNTIEAISGRNDYLLKINGYADNTGSSGYNMKLSKKRTQAVADHFIINGVSKDVIEQHAYGEASSGNNQQNNRRVEINIEPGQ